MKNKFDKIYRATILSQNNSQSFRLTMLTPTPSRINTTPLKCDTPNEIDFIAVTNFLVAFDSWMAKIGDKYKKQSSLISRVTAYNIFRDKTFNLQWLSHKWIDDTCFFSENEQYPSQWRYLPVFYVKKPWTNKYYRYWFDIRVDKGRSFITQDEETLLSRAFSEYAAYLKWTSINKLKKSDWETVEEKAAAILNAHPGYTADDYKKAIHDISAKVLITETKIADLEWYIALRISQYDSLTQLPVAELSDWRKGAISIAQELDILRDQSGIDTIHKDMKRVIDLVIWLHKQLVVYRNSRLNAESRKEKKRSAAELSFEIWRYTEEKNNLETKLDHQKRAIAAYTLLLEKLGQNPPPSR